MENESYVSYSIQSQPENNYLNLTATEELGSASVLTQFPPSTLHASVTNFTHLPGMLSGPEALNYLRTSKNVHQLCESILMSEQTLSREEIRSTLSVVRQLHRQSPFFVRTQDWPRGYAGDFETIEYIVRGVNQAPKQSVGYYLESIILNSPIVQQHRNKVRHQADLILKKVRATPGARILSIGCGSSADLQLIQETLETAPVHITLFDMDEGALACSREKLPLLADKCTFVQGNLYRMAQKLQERYDLIVIGGVFDYLSDRHIVSLLGKLYGQNLLAGGEIFFTNIAAQNPYRTWMEYCFDWFLIERTQEHIEQLCQQAGLEGSTLTIRRDETALTFLAHLCKND